MIRAVIFDFDGLILDTESALYRSWQRTYAAYGCTLPLDLWAANIGGYSYEVFHPLRHLEEQSGQAIDHDAVNAARRAWYLEQVQQQAAIPAACNALRSACDLGLNVGIASSSSTNWVPKHLARLGLDGLVDVVRCGNEVAARKPDPAVYQATLEALGAPASEAFAIEDSPGCGTW